MHRYLSLVNQLGFCWAKQYPNCSYFKYTKQTFCTRTVLSCTLLVMFNSAMTWGLCSFQKIMKALSVYFMYGPFWSLLTKTRETVSQTCKASLLRHQRRCVTVGRGQSSLQGAALGYPRRDAASIFDALLSNSDRRRQRSRCRWSVARRDSEHILIHRLWSVDRLFPCHGVLETC